MNVLDPFKANPNLARLVRRYLWAFPVVAAFAIAIGLLEGVGVSLLIPFVSTLADSSANSGRIMAFVARFAQGDTRNERLFLITAAILGCTLLKNAFQISANAFAAWVDGRVGHDIRCGLSERLHQVGYSFFLVQDSARLMNILGTESWKTSDAVRVVLTRIAATSTVAVFGVLLLLVNWRLSLMVLAGGLLARYIQKVVEAKLRKLSQRTVSTNQVLADRMLFTIFGARVIRLFNQQQAEQEHFASTCNNVRRAILRVECVAGSLPPLLEGMHGFVLLTVLLFAVFSGMPLPVLAAFLVLMNRLQPHLRSLEQSGAVFASSAGQLGEVEWLLNGKDKPPAPTGDLEFEGLCDGIEFDHVTFEYGQRGAEPALMNANFTLRHGRSTALIGGSGAGKSTVLNLLCRLLEPVSGTIRIDGQPLSRIKVSDWLNTIAVAGQDIDLIEGTIAENIAYGRPKLGRDKIQQAAQSAGADFIDSLPLGLDSLVGPRGLSLSGGQRQRIGIARAIAREPGLLILDEATNAIDHETESCIIRTLENLPHSMTVIVVSHRPSTIAFCDDAVVLNAGRVTEAGPLSSISFYRAMQAGNAESLIAAQNAND